MARLSCGIIICVLLAVSLWSASVQGRSLRKKGRTKASTIKLTVLSTTTPQPDGRRPSQSRRRLPERVQVRLDMLRGRRIDLNLTKSRSVNFKVRGKKRKDRDEDDEVPEGRHGGSRVLVGERGRVSAWSDSDDEVFDVYEDRNYQASMVVVNSTKNGRKKQRYMGCVTIDGVMYSLRPYVRGALSRTPYPPTFKEVNYGDDTYRLIPIEHRLNFDDAPRPKRTRPFSATNTSTVRPPRAGNGWRRQKRETATRQENFLEMLVVLDYSIYYSWYVSSLESSPAEKRQDAIRNIIYYYTNVINGVNMRYSSINESDFSISVNVAQFYIATTPSDAPWTESPNIKVDDSNVLGYDALTRLEYWAANEAPLMFEFQFDQATLFSGYTFFRYASETDPTKLTFSGLANIGSVCDPARSTSINQEFGEYADIQTGAHELGHKSVYYVINCCA